MSRKCAANNLGKQATHLAAEVLRADETVWVGWSSQDQEAQLTEVGSFTGVATDPLHLGQI